MDGPLNGNNLENDEILLLLCVKPAIVILINKRKVEALISKGRMDGEFLEEGVIICRNK